MNENNDQPQTPHQAPSQPDMQAAATETAATANEAAGADAAATDPSAQISALQAQVTELKDQALRAVAEAQNAHRRAQEEVSKARKFALESFAESLLPVLDSLEAGLAIQDAKLEQIREGSEATLRQLKSALERNKVIAIDPAQGSKFDPAVHQAISMVPAEQEANTIVGVLQKGYTIAERVLRPALVTVAAAK
jgi:molecular chaperone GrpE